MILINKKTTVFKALFLTLIFAASAPMAQAANQITIEAASAASGEGSAPTIVVRVNNPKGVDSVKIGPSTIINSAKITDTKFKTYSFNLATKPAPGSNLDIIMLGSAKASHALLIKSIKVDGFTLPFASGRYDIGTGSAAYDEVNVVPITSGPNGTTMASDGALRFVLSSGLTAPQMGLVINDADPYSVAIGEYYRTKRGIPPANIVHVNLPLVNIITRDQFAPIKQQIDSKLPSYVQGIALAWEKPYAVECNSITSAVSIGFQPAPCPNTCNLGTDNPYYNTTDTLPFTQRGIRPSMLLAAKDVDTAKALINKGIASNRTNPTGTAYIMSTSDTLRSGRATLYPTAYLGKVLSPNVDVTIVRANSITQKNDVVFYFQGAVGVPNLATNNYPAGAIADTFTSYSGALNDPKGQMSILEFITAGATGSFGTVNEPCAYMNKFPEPKVAIKYYTVGQTLLESYWKSLGQTFQGLFIGDPLANPWETYLLTSIDTLPPTAPPYIVGDFFPGSDDGSGGKLPPSISIAWNPSQDDIKVTGYKVYKNGAYYAQTSSTYLNDYTIVIDPATTYTYSVSAVDASGKESAKSSVVSVTTTALPSPPFPCQGDYCLPPCKGENCGPTPL